MTQLRRCYSREQIRLVIKKPWFLSKIQARVINQLSNIYINLFSRTVFDVVVLVNTLKEVTANHKPTNYVLIKFSRKDSKQDRPKTRTMELWRYLLRDIITYFLHSYLKTAYTVICKWILYTCLLMKVCVFNNRIYVLLNIYRYNAST